MKINLAPIKFSNKAFLERLIRDLKNVFQVNIEILDLFLDISDSYSAERKQFYSTKILETAIKNTGQTEGKILIITEMDLYVPVLTFVFGEAQLNGKYSVISSCRLHEEFYTGHTNNELFYERLLKETLHELGHNFGLLHCLDWDCVMHSSNSIEEVDIKGLSYCGHCRKEINLL
ncbi:MAG: archaemetzincin family Zn-dependent metalloprotease [Ignavibacteriae bacterium]|nr:archaemetzincin family Zn-dependent metalloprotease [Ignavibacteriota bacterium]